MHELSVCQALIDQVTRLVQEHQVRAVERIVLRIGPLSGIEAPLLEEAYPIAAAGTVAEGAQLDIESMPIKVRCRTCGAETEARPNRLVCARCGDWHTDLLSGDELILASLEFLATRH